MDGRLAAVLADCVSISARCCAFGTQNSCKDSDKTMTKKLISSGSPFEEVAGYSRAVVQGDWCFVAGTTGYDYETMTMPDGVEDQTRNTLATIDNAIDEAGFSRSDIVRAQYTVTDAAYADIVFPILGEYFEGIRPAATMVVAGLIKPEMKVEIEVTALKGN